MIKVSVEVRKPGTKTERGEVVYTLARDNERVRIASGVTANKVEVRNRFRPLIVHGIKVLYCIIEEFHSSGKKFGLDDVAGRFKLEETLMHTFESHIVSAGHDFAINNDIATIGRHFQTDFRIKNRYETGNPDNVLDYIWDKLLTLKRLKRTCSANAYRSVLNSLVEYPGGRNCTLGEINADFITGYYKFLKDRGIGSSTQAFYMRTFKTILNRANAEGRCGITGTLFADIHSSVGRTGLKADEKALDANILRKIAGLDLGNFPALRLARDLFMFSFYCKGMELADIARLRPANIVDSHLIFRKRIKGVEQRIRLRAKAQAIIDRYRNPEAEYLFPILEGHDLSYYKCAMSFVSRGLREIGRLAGCTAPLTFSVSRYSWLVLTREGNTSEKLLE